MKTNNEAVQKVKQIVGDSFAVRATALDSRRVFIKCIAKAGSRDLYTMHVAAAVTALHSAGYPSAERGHFSNTVSLFA